jgi:isopenicillin-N N-acyltransferase-like protein
MFPHVRISGSAHERGRQYGTQAAERVHRSIAAYRGVFAHYAQWDWARVTQEARRYVPAVEDFGPAYLEEMRGIADGAGVAFDDVMAINVRTEVMYAAKARNAAAILPRTLECTSFAAVPDDGRPVLVGQNWDWKTHAFDTAVVLECEPDDGPRYVTAVEAGLLAKTGFNEHGIGIATNALASDRDLGEPGVPYHVLLRALLAADTPTAALASLQRSFRASSAHYLIAHRDHLALSVEAVPGTFVDLHLTQPDERGILLHGNHFTHPGMRDVDVSLWLMPDSVFRLQRARRWLDGHDPFAAETYEAMFADHAGHPLGICCHPEPMAIAAEQDSTVLSVVMDLGAMTLRIADGRPCEVPYRTLAYSSFLQGAT